VYLVQVFSQLFKSSFAKVLCLLIPEMVVWLLISNNFFTDPTKGDFAFATRHFVAAADLFGRDFALGARPKLHIVVLGEVCEHKLFLTLVVFTVFLRAIEADRS
jgi:hypothetical protein